MGRSRERPANTRVELEAVAEIAMLKLRAESEASACHRLRAELEASCGNRYPYAGSRRRSGSAGHHHSNVDPVFKELVKGLASPWRSGTGGGAAANGGLAQRGAATDRTCQARASTGGYTC